MESDIDITKFARSWSFSKRLKNITEKRPACINVQNAAADDDDDIYRIREQQYEAEQKYDGDDNADKIRRHLPPPTGKYSVGCVDIMDNSSEQGSFFRLYYPVEKTDILVSIIYFVLP